MVDPVNTSGQISQIKSVQAKQDTQRTQDAARKTEVQRDEVVISQDAKALQRAEKDAEQVAKSLSRDSTISLSSNPEKLNALI